MNALLQRKFFRVCLGIIFLLLIIYLTSKVSFLFKPLITIFDVLIVPFMMAAFFYYLLRPVVNYLGRKKVNKMITILLIYLVLIGAVVVFLIVIWPTLQEQINNFADSVPQLVEGFQNQINHLRENRLISMFVSSDSNFPERMSEYLSKGITDASIYVSNIFTMITSLVIVVFTVPIILYYMLKDSENVPYSVMHIVPKRYSRDGKEMIDEIDAALSGFIVGRVIITGLLGVMLYIGFLIIGLPYALLLTVIATILNLIPYIGSILGAIPCIIVAFIVSPTMVFWVIVVTLIAQQIEGNLLSPHIYGKKLDIHPMTTIIILLVAGELTGILGIILAIPAYMVAKVIVIHVYRLFLAEKVEEFIE